MTVTPEVKASAGGGDERSLHYLIKGRIIRGRPFKSISALLKGLQNCYQTYRDCNCKGDPKTTYACLYSKWLRFRFGFLQKA